MRRRSPMTFWLCALVSWPCPPGRRRPPSTTRSSSRGPPLTRPGTGPGAPSASPPPLSPLPRTARRPGAISPPRAAQSAKGDKEAGFGYLDKAAEKGHDDLDRAQTNANLEPLRQDPRWQKFLDGVKARNAAHQVRLNAELTRLYEEDQSDRSGGPGQADMAQRDAGRRKRVLEILGQGTLKEADDYFHAAMVFQHGDAPETSSGRTTVPQGRGARSRQRQRPVAGRRQHGPLPDVSGQPQLYGTQSRGWTASGSSGQ